MTSPAMRIDRWLWHARFFRTRTMAAHVVASGRVRLNRQRITKSHARLQPGDVLTFPQNRRVRVVRVLEVSERRGPPSEAAGLYEDMTAGDAAP